MRERSDYANTRQAHDMLSSQAAQQALNTADLQFQSQGPWREEARRCAAEVAARPDAVRQAAFDARLARMEAIFNSMETLLTEAFNLVQQENRR